LAQGLPFEQFRNNVGGAVINTYVVDGKNIWMAEGGGSSSFLLKAPNAILIGRRCRTNDFDGNVAFETIVAGD